MDFKRNGYVMVWESFIFGMMLLFINGLMFAYIEVTDPTTEVTFTGVVEMIDDTTVKLNTGQEVIQIQLNLGDDTKNFKRMIHPGLKGSFYLINHKKDDTFVLNGLTHTVFTGFFSSHKEDNVKVLE